MNRNRRLFRAGAAALAAQVFFTNCLLANTAERSFYEERAQKTAKTALLASLPVTLPFVPSTSPRAAQLIRSESPADAISLDASIGTVRSISRNSHPNRSITYIQDVHGNDEAQRHIAQAVAALINQGKADVIVLEGAAGPVDLDVFRGSPWRDSAVRTAEGLLASHRISGAVLGAVMANRAVPVVGAELLPLYNENVAAVRLAQGQVPAARAALTERRAALEVEKNRVFSPALLAYDRIVAGRRAGTVPLGRYAEAIVLGQKSLSTDVATFLEAVRLEDALDTKATERERSALLSRLAPTLSDTDTRDLIQAGIEYRAGKIRASDFYRRLSDVCRRCGLRLADFPAMNRFVRYVLLADTIDMERVSAELDRLEGERYARLAATAAERRLVQDDATLSLQQNLVEFSLNSDEWARYRPFSGRDPMLAAFESFYSSADRRNQAISRNVLQAMQAHGPRALLVTGGFHAKAVTSSISARASVTNFVPRLSVVDAASTTEALSVFTREKTPLDRILEGDRLFLAPHPLPAAARMAAEPMAAADALRSGVATKAAAQASVGRTSGWMSTTLANRDRNVSMTIEKNGVSAELLVPFDEKNLPGYPRLLGVMNRYRSVALNSSFVLAPLFTYLTFAAFSALGFPMDVAWAPALWLLHKGILLIAVSFHERGHLIAAGKFPWGDPDTQMRLIADALLHDPAIRTMSNWELARRMALPIAFGTDITDAGVVSLETDPARVREIARAGPAVNVRFSLYGLGAFVVSAAAFAAGAPVAFALPMAVVGFSLMLVNLSLLVINVAGTDYRAMRTGERPAVYRVGPGSTTPEQILYEDEVTLPRTNDLLTFNRVIVQRYLDIVDRELGDAKADSFDGIMYHAVLAITGPAIRDGDVKFQLRSSIDAGEFKLKIAFEKGRVGADEIAALQKDWMSGGWRMTVAEAEGTGLQTFTIVGPINLGLSLETLPATPSDMRALMAKFRDDTRSLARERVRSALNPASDARPFYFGTDRLLASLWMGDAEILSLAARRLLESPDADARARLAAELNELSASADADVSIRRQAAWFLATIPGLVKETAPGTGWRYDKLNGMKLSGGRTLRADFSSTGAVDLVVEETAGLLGLVLKIFRIRLNRTVAVIRLTWPRVVAAGTDPLDAESLRYVRLSFPSDKRPSIEMFDAIMRFWGAEVAPMQTILDMPADSRKNQPIREAGFRRNVHHDLNDGMVTIQKTAEARAPQTGNKSLDSGSNYFWIFFRMIVGLPINFIGFLDEVFHWVGSLIEGTQDNTGWVTRICILLGIEIAESDLPPQSEDYYQAHPLRRDFRIIAAPLGWVLTLATFGTLIGLNMAGMVELPTWAIWTMYYLVAGAVIELLITFLLTTSIGKALIGPDFKGTDFWRWYDSVTKKRVAPRPQPQSGANPTLEELLERARNKMRSPSVDLAGAIRGLFKAIADGWRARRLAAHGFDDIQNAIRADMSATGALSAATTENIRFRANHLLRRLLRNPAVADVRKYHEITFAVLLTSMKSGSNPLVGARPLMTDGEIVPDALLQGFFTTDGWAAYQAYRSGRPLSVAGGLIQRPAMGRVRLMLSALDPNKLDDFFLLVGKPEAAAEARRLLESGLGAGVSILDTAAIPWTELADGAQLGSVSGELSARSRSDGRDYLRQLFASDAAVLVAATLLNRTKDLTDQERAALLDAVRSAIDGSKRAPLPANYSAEREEMGRDVRQLTAFQQVETEKLHSGHLDFLTSLRGLNAGSDALVPADSAEDETSSRDWLTPGGTGGTSGGPGGIPLLVALSQGALARDGSVERFEGVPAAPEMAPNEDPLLLMLLDLKRGQPSTASVSAEAAEQNDVVVPNSDTTSAPTRSVAAPARNAQPGLFAPLTPLAKAPPLSETTAADAAPQPVGNKAALTTLPQAISNDGRTLSADGRTTTAAPSDADLARDQERSGRAVGAGNDLSSARQAAEPRDADPTRVSSELLSSRADALATRTAANAAADAKSGQTAADKANGLQTRAAERPAPPSNLGASPLQAGSPLSSVLNFFTSRGYDIVTFVAALTASVALLALANQSLGVVHNWLPSAAVTAITAGIAVVIASLRDSQPMVPAGFAPGLTTEGRAFPGIPANAFSRLSSLRERLRDETASPAGSVSGNPSPTGRLYLTTGLQATTAGLYAVARFLTRTVLPARVGTNDLFDAPIAELRARAAYSAAVATLDAAAALMAERRGITVTAAVSLLADDQVTAEERAVVQDLARATQNAARAAIARTIAGRSTEERAALAADALDRTPSSIRPTLVELRNVALVYRERAQRAGQQPRDERAGQFSRSVSRGLALLALERAWARELMDAAPARPRSVPIIKLPSGRASATRTSAKQTKSQPRIGADGVLENSDLSDVRAAGGRVRGAALSARLGFGTDGSLARTAESPLTTPANRQLVAALGIAAAENSASLALGGASVSNEKDSGGILRPATDLAAGLAAMSPTAPRAGRADAAESDPGRVFVDKILGGLKKPASIAAVATVVVLAGAAIALGVVEAVVAVLTVTVMMLVAIGAQVAKLQNSAREARDASSAAPVPDAATASGRNAGQEKMEDLAGLADLIAKFVLDRSRLSPSATPFDLDLLLPRVGSLGIGDERAISAVGGLTEEEFAVVERLVSDRLRDAGVKTRPSEDEALSWLKAAMTAAKRERPLESLAADKDLFYPVRERAARPDMNAELDGVASIRQRLADGRTLFLSYENDDVRDLLSNRFARDIASGRIRLMPRASRLFTNREGREVLNLAALAAGLSELLGDKQAKNLLILIPDHVGWDEAGLNGRSVLDEVGFVLLKDFVAGIQVDRVALRNIGRLAQMIASQA